MSTFDYTIRESKRARRMQIRITPQQGVEVVIPSGGDRQPIPAFVQQHQQWIKKNLSKQNERRTYLEAQNQLPQEIIFPAIAKAYRIQYESSAKALCGYHHSQKQIFTLKGDLNDVSGSRQILKKWVIQRGQQYLLPLLKSLSQELKLPYRRGQVRLQKTLWGSCTHQQNISLNGKLLFLTPPQVRYVMVHELCHTQQANHSADFWQLVGKFESNYRSLDRSLRGSWKVIPPWLS